MMFNVITKLDRTIVLVLTQITKRRIILHLSNALQNN